MNTKIKPAPEAVANEFLTGVNLRSCLSFIDFLNSEKYPPRWIAKNAWEVKPNRFKILGQLKSQILRRLRINPDEKNWSVSFHYNPEYNELITDEEMQKFITANIRNKRNACHGEDCGAYIDLNVFGKIYNEMCCNEQIQITNPSGKEVEYIKELFLLTKEITERATLTAKDIC